MGSFVLQTDETQTRTINKRTTAHTSTAALTQLQVCAIDGVGEAASVQINVARWREEQADDKQVGIWTYYEMGKRMQGLVLTNV